MATLEPTALRWLATQWETAIDSAERRSDAATFSGIVGDAAHRLEGGYHISREDQPADNYSVADCPEDRRGRADRAAAVDMNMIVKDMRLVYGRLYKSWKDASDPRLNHVRGINGTLDGVNPLRIDCQFGTQESSTDDHLWHVHLEVLRQYVEDMPTMRDILSVILGQPYPPPPPPEDDVQLTDHLTSKLNNQGRTVDNVLGDLSNLRDGLIGAGDVVPGDGSWPKPESVLGRLLAAASRPPAEVDAAAVAQALAADPVFTDKLADALAAKLGARLANG